MGFFRKKPHIDVPAPSAVDTEQLYQKLMPELGMEAKTPSQRQEYHTTARTRFILPKATRVYLICTIVWVITLLLFFPARMGNLNIDPSGTGGVEISFTVTRFPLLDHVIAQIDGTPLPVTKNGNTYTVQTDKNGVLTLTVETLMGRITSHSIDINSVDDQAPRIVDHFSRDNSIYIYLTDDDGSGVNWERITATNADTGSSVPLIECNEGEGYIRLPFPGESITILAPDYSGNTLTAILELVQ